MTCISTRLIEDSVKDLEIGGSGSIIYLPFLVPQSFAWSTQKGTSTSYFRDKEPSLCPWLLAVAHQEYWRVILALVLQREREGSCLYLDGAYPPISSICKGYWWLCWCYFPFEWASVINQLFASRKSHNGINRHGFLSPYLCFAHWRVRGYAVSI